MNTTQDQEPKRSAMIFIFITVVFDMLALGVIIPVLPKLIEQLSGGDTSRAAMIFGIFGTVWALMQFFCSPLLGILSDCFGRRPVILISCFGLGLDYILMALAPSISWLFIGRVLSGITSASVPTAGAYIADVTPPEKRSSAFGMLGAAFGIGFVLGPALGGVLGSVSPRLPFWVSAGLTLMNAVYGFFVLPESLAPENRIPFSLKRANPVASLNFLKTKQALFSLAGSAFFSTLAHVVLPSVYVLYASFRYGWSERTIGLTLAIVGVCSGVAQSFVGPVVKRFGENRVMMAGIAFGIAGFAVFGLAPNGTVFLFGIPLLALWGMGSSASQSIMTQHVGAQEQGQLQGAVNSLKGIAELVGPGFFTMVFAHFIRESGTGITLPGAPFVAAAILLLTAMFLAWQALAVSRPEPAPAVPADK